MKQALQLGVLSAANIGLAFVFQWYALTHLGVGADTDALFAGMTLPQLVLAVVSGSLMHVLVPLLAGEDPDQSRRDAWSFTVLVGGVFGLIALALHVTAAWWVPLTIPGFASSAQDLTIELTRIQLIGMVFSAINGVQWAAYHARHQFLRAEITPFLASLISIALLAWALPRYGVVSAAWIASLRLGLQTLFLAPGLGRPVRPALNSPAIRTAWQRIRPLLLGTTYYKTDVLVDRILLSMAGTGSLSLYYLAQQIYGAANQVLNKAVAAPMVPRLSTLHKTGDRAGFRRLRVQREWQMAAVGLLGTLVVWLAGEHVLALFFAVGHFSVDKVRELAWIMLLLGGMFVGSLTGQICSSAFYSLGDTRTPTYMSMITYTLYVPAKIAAFLLWGLTGLALVTSIYSLLTWLVQSWLLHRNAAA